MFPLNSQRNFEAKLAERLDRCRDEAAAGTLRHANGRRTGPRDAEGAVDEKVAVALHGA